MPEGCGDGANAVEAVGLAAARDGRIVWSDGTFDLPVGTITGVIGPNGSGKTTLLRVLLGLHPVAAGSVKVLGRVPHRGDPRIGYVAQDFAVREAATLTCRDLVAVAVSRARPGTKGGGWWRELRRRRRVVGDALDAVGVSDIADRRWSAISGGQQQRVAIAQALVGDPEMLLLDEPLANLDPDARAELVGLLERLVGERGLTAVVVAHDLGPLLPVLHGAVYLLDGHAHHDLLDNVDPALLTHLYGGRVRVVRTPQGDLFAPDVDRDGRHGHNHGGGAGR
ncbi:MAG: ATP-binding cassette domain-containing protein [Microthrixaceae bacterium]